MFYKLWKTPWCVCKNLHFASRWFTTNTATTTTTTTTTPKHHHNLATTYMHRFGSRTEEPSSGGTRGVLCLASLQVHYSTPGVLLQYTRYNTLFVCLSVCLSCINIIRQIIFKKRADTALTHSPPNPTSPELRYPLQETGSAMTMALPYRQKAMVKKECFWFLLQLPNTYD